MKKLFIYYSLSGNGDMIAEEFKKHDYDICKVTEKKKMPKSFFWTVLKGGFLAGLKHKSDINDFEVDPCDYDEIVVGSPIWNGRFSCPINTVIEKLGLGKNVSFVLYSGSGEGKNAAKFLEENGIRYIILQEPKKHYEELNKLILI